MTGVHFLDRFAVFGLGTLLFHLDDVKAKLGFNYLANLSRLERKGGLLKFRYHCSRPKPTEVTTLYLASRIRGKLSRQFRKVLAGFDALQNIFSLGSR